MSRSLLIWIILSFSAQTLYAYGEVTSGVDDFEPAPAPSLFAPQKPFDQMSPKEREQYVEYLQQSRKMDPDNPYGNAKYAELNPHWPQASKVVAIARCNPRDKEFELIVYLDGKPYRRWPTSPGKQAYNSVDGFDMRTNLSEDPKGSCGNQVSGTTRNHIVSDSKSYAGASMEYAVWVGKCNGFAVHATTSNHYHELGKPASNGCLRLRREHAKEFYELVSRVGTSNANVFFAGYSCDGEVSEQPQKPRVQGLLQRLFQGN